MKIRENIPAKGIFHHDKSNRIKIYIFSMFSSLSKPKHLLSDYSLFLFISISEYIGR